MENSVFGVNNKASFGKMLSSELYRVAHMKVTYILMIVLFLLSFLFGYIFLGFPMEDLTGITAQDYEDIANSADSESFSDAFTMGFEAGAKSSSSVMQNEANEIKLIGEGLFYNEDASYLFSVLLSSGFISLLLAIFVGITMGDVYSLGLDRNIVAYANKRMTLFSARAVVILIYSVVLLFVQFLCTLFSDLVFTKTITWGIDIGFFKFCLFEIIIVLALGLFFYMFVFLFRSKTAGIVLSVLIATGILEFVVMIFDLLLDKLISSLPRHFSIGNYLLSTSYPYFTIESSAEDTMRIIIVSLIYIAISIGAYFLSTRKRDIHC